MAQLHVKRVLHVFHLCGVAGTEAVIRHLIRGFADLGVESEVFFQRDIGGSYQFRSLCPIHFEGEVSLRALLESGRFDAIHAVTSALTLNLTRAVAEARFTGPIIAACHNDYIVGWNARNADSIVALTRDWAERIRPYTDLPIEVIGNPIDQDRFSPPTSTTANGRPILAWVGRSSDPWKNLQRLIDLLPLLPEDAYDLHVADTNLRDSAEELFGPLAHRVKWYGKVPYAEMPEFYRRIAASRGVLLSTSDSEAFPMCVLEALASGCPAIVPDAWGADEIVEDGRAGLVYRRADGAEGIVRSLRQAAEPGVWERLSAGARETVEERYLLGVIARRYLELFERYRGRERPRAAGGAVRWGCRSLSFYSRRPPMGITLYRPRRAAEAIERALRATEDRQPAEVRAALLDALRSFPLVYLKPWRAKFLLRTLLRPQ